ncbi:MAG TPA: PIG-L family deacetylase [Ignavibacteria bacterium]|nr:PIG-L family deacetylase [Ignavibacteria bacterium]HQY51927.1 PIG-L family deacetylase [Ignavibacteria bacterium]
MKILYVFPHPDDESFGVAHAMSKQLREGHEVYLLTLTKGGATKQRFKYNYSVEEMGEVRFNEMKNVEKVLGLTGMTVLDLPDSGMKEMNPEDIEKVVEDEIMKIKPDVIVSYPVHGISGFQDHLVMHGVIKSVFCRLRTEQKFLKRLAFITVTKEDSEVSEFFKLSFSTESEIDCVIETEDSDIQKAIDSLDCYVTFSETIEKSNIKNFIKHKVNFEIFQEDHDPVLKSLFENLNK